MTVDCNIKLEAFCCIKCGVLFAINEEHVSLLMKTGEDIHCPNGHVNGWTKVKSKDAELADARNEISRLKGELVECRRRAEMAEAKAEDAMSKQPRPANRRKSDTSQKGDA